MNTRTQMKSAARRNLRLATAISAIAVEKAIRGMLPKNSLGRSMIRKLHVVPGPEHPHAAQQPKKIEVA